MRADDSETIIVIDDFLSRPEEMRARGLASAFPLSEGELYPGRNSSGRFELPMLDDIVSKLTGQTLVPAEGTSHGSFRLCFEGERGAGGVHIDACHWSSILYLSLPDHCQGGTDFFRHRATRTIRAPVFPGEKEQLPITWEALREDMIGAAANDPAKWEQIRHVPMRFNRFVLFRPWLWHNAGPGFGLHPENGRLIYVAFYNCVDPGWV